ncbi:MAG: serine hydrolase [Alphaproteobacteria bacterium]|nr:serine hydrolase [Alphaproteobacteria bacterium]
MRRVILVLAALAAHASAQAAPITDYVGTYADGSHHTIEIVAGKTLFAVVDGATYALKVSGPDEVTTVNGEKIPFRRDIAGKVSGYEESGQFHRRLSTSVSAEAAQLAYPRPAGEVYRYAIPADRHDGIAVGSIANTPLGVATADAIVAKISDGTYPNVHSVLLYQNGRLVMEEYFYGYSAGRRHQLRSATKSIVSALAGIAVDHGKLSIDAPALGLLGLRSPANPDPRKAKITVRDFLTMRSGLACNDHSADSPGRETVIDAQPDWVKAMFDLPQVNDPGKDGYYCSGGVAVVGRIVENATKSYLPDYARTHLFAPLGITDWTWNYDLTNKDTEYSQIHLRPRDMLKLGILYADDGRWHHRQIISKQWVRASLRKQSMVDDTEYGYFWWRPWLNVGGKPVYVRAAQGNGGQKIYILPEYRLVAVFTGGDYNAASSPMNKIMIDDVLPKLMAAYPEATTPP